MLRLEPWTCTAHFAAHKSCFRTPVWTVVLNNYVGQGKTKDPCFTRRNIFLRDRFSCQYCKVHLPMKELTYDHVVPRSKGGPTSWDNIVTCCNKCNRRKASRALASIPDMQLSPLPRKPTWPELQQKARAFPPRDMHEDWADYLGIPPGGSLDVYGEDGEEYGI